MKRPLDRYVDRLGTNPLTGTPVEFLRLDHLSPPPDDPGTLRLRKTKTTDKDSPVSRFGGRPNLLRGKRWPMGPSGPMTFVGQLRFEDLAMAPHGGLRLPARGLLALFYDTEDCVFGNSRRDSRSWRLLYTEDVAGAVPLDNQEADPTPLRLLSARYEPLGGKASTPDHRVGGRPRWIQGDGRVPLELMLHGLSTDLPKLRAAEKRGKNVVRLAKGASRWTLLWQIDSDDELGFTWFDSGRLYVMVPHDDLARKRFDRARCLIQTT
jgi:hypothetical protein